MKDFGEIINRIKRLMFPKKNRCKHNWKCIHQLEDIIFDEDFDKYPSDIYLTKVYECQECHKTKEVVIKKL
jgi:hypothetical protein